MSLMLFKNWLFVALTVMIINMDDIALHLLCSHCYSLYYYVKYCYCLMLMINVYGISLHTIFKFISLLYHYWYVFIFTSLTHNLYHYFVSNNFPISLHKLTKFSIWVLFKFKLIIRVDAIVICVVSHLIKCNVTWWDIAFDMMITYRYCLLIVVIDYDEKG